MSLPTDILTVAIDAGRAYFAAPAERDVPNTFIADATRIGDAMRQSHETIAAAEEPEPATHEDLDRWVDRARTAVAESLDLLGQHAAGGQFPKSGIPQAEALMRRRADYLAWIDDLADQLGDDLGTCIRIDDAGDEKTSPLREVADALEQIEVAAATLTASVEKTVDLATREVRAGRWSRDVRAAYLEGYVGKPDDDEGPGILPEESANVARLVALFEADTAFSGLTHELNTRPAQAWIPMRGIAKLLAR